MRASSKASRGVIALCGQSRLRVRAMKRSHLQSIFEYLFFTLGLTLLIVGGWFGLSQAPPDRMMGEVQRIMYVHVPAAWMALISFTFALIASLFYLWKKAIHYDAWAEASIEVGILFNVMCLVLGAIWGRPTWGVYWTWDPRLTSVAVMLMMFVGCMALRSLVEESERRARLSAISAIIAYLNLPLVWFSVKFWRGLHQTQSSPQTVDPQMVIALRISAFAFLFLTLSFISRRYTIAKARRMAELTLTP